MHVEPQVFDVLAYLVAHRDRVVPKTELLDAVWGDRFVSESALTSRIKEARRAVGDDGAAPAVHPDRPRPRLPLRRRRSRTRATRRSGAPAPRPRRRDRAGVRYCVAGDGVCVAYAVGRRRATARQGGQLADPPRARLAQPGLAALARTSCAAARSWCATTSGAAACRTGTSSDFELDAWVEDLEIVVDAVGLDRFPLLGVSQGGAVAIAYAVRHPERGRRLVLVGAYAQGRLVRADHRGGAARGGARHRAGAGRLAP